MPLRWLLCKMLQWCAAVRRVGAGERVRTHAGGASPCHTKNVSPFTLLASLHITYLAPPALLPSPPSPPLQMLARHLSRVMMVGLEVALELWQALTVSPQAQWLDYAGDTGLQLRAELNLQAEQVGCCHWGWREYCHIPR